MTNTNQQPTASHKAEWYACKSDGDKICIRARYKDETEGFRRIAHLNEGSASGYIPEDYEFANLIAAAPELLEALKMLQADVDIMDYLTIEQADKINKAIAKAEGRA